MQMTPDGWVNLGIFVATAFAAWMTKMSVGLSRLERLIQDVERVQERIEHHDQRLTDHDLRIAKLEPKAN